MHDASAHTSEAYSPIRKITQLGDFFKHSMQDVVSSISQKGYISVQVIFPSLPLSSQDEALKIPPFKLWHHGCQSITCFNLHTRIEVRE